MREAYQRGYFETAHSLASTPAEHDTIEVFKRTMQHSRGQPSLGEAAYGREL